MATDEASLRRHRALADPSRARILGELVDGGPRDARQLAEEVGLHVNTVRVHLSALVDAGLVASEKQPPRGRGRPRIAYRATAAAADEGGRHYRLLAEVLTALVARVGPEATEQLEEMAESWGRYLVESPAPFATLSEAEVSERLLGLLAEVGFEPRLEQTARERKILMRPCPFLELARAHRDVICPIHLGLMRGALAELGAGMRATKLEPFVRPDLCVARITSSHRPRPLPAG